MKLSKAELQAYFLAAAQVEEWLRQIPDWVARLGEYGIAASVFGSGGFGGIHSHVEHEVTELIILAARVEALDQAAAKLPDTLRKLVRLYYVNGLTIRELCLVLGIRKASFHRHRMHALAHLIHSLQGRAAELGLDLREPVKVDSG